MHKETGGVNPILIVVLVLAVLITLWTFSL